MSQNISEYLVDLLEEAGVTRVWGVTGDSLNGISDAMTKKKDIQWMPVRHEEVAAFACGAYGAITGELTVCAGSCGPGNTHLINGVFDCHRNHVPTLVIASHIPSNTIGSGYFQETHPQELFKECSVFCELISDPDQMPYILETAMRQAILEQDVAVIVLPGNIALKPMPENTTIRWSKPLKGLSLPSEDEVDEIAKTLNSSDNTVLFCGSGCKGAHDEVIALAEKLKAPIVHALRGKEFIEYDNPYDVGMTGFIGVSSGFHAMDNAHTLLILGSAFPYRNFYPKKAKVIQIDQRSKALGAYTQVDIALQSDVKATIEALLPKLEQKTDADFLNSATEHYKEARKGLDKLATGDSKSGMIHPQFLTHLLSEKANEDAIFTADVGTPTVWAARYLKMNGKRRLLGSFNHGSMANAMAQALGAQAVDKKRQVIAMCGDGGFSMLMGDLLSVKQLDLPVKLVVYDNGSLGFVAMEMKAAGFYSHDTDLHNPSFSEIAKAAGLAGETVEDPADLPNAVDRMLAYDGAYLLCVKTAKQELIMPPEINLTEAKGFGLYMLRAVLNGDSNTLVELGKTNLLKR